MMSRDFLLDSNQLKAVAGNFIVNVVAWLILTAAQPTLAQAPQENFASAEQASQSLYNAVRNKNDQAVQAILGAPKLASSGDDSEEKLQREHFAQKYAEMHRLVREADGSVVLYIGAENWPFPLPLVSIDGKWHFDPDAGSQEILARTIGENETVAIEICKRIGNVNVPDADKNVGTASINEFIHNLSQSESTAAKVELFNGYYFRVLGKKADELMVVAYPEEYRSSGVMTFVVQNGAVYERDLGPQTAAFAQKIQGNPSGNWSSVK